MTHVDGVRDDDAPCTGFKLGPCSGAGTCQTDGHYVCQECVHIDPRWLGDRARAEREISEDADEELRLSRQQRAAEAAP